MPEQDVYAEFADPVGPSATAVADPPDPYAEFADPVAPAAPAGATEADPYAAFADPVTPSATPRGQPDPYAEFADPVQPEKPYSLGADVSAAPGEAGRGFARGGASVSAGLGGLLEAAGRAGSRFESNVARELQMRWFYPGGKWNPVLSAFGMKEPEPGAEGDTLRQGGTEVTRGYKAVGEAGQKWAEKMETIQAGPELAPRPEGPYSKVAGIVWQAAPIVTGLIATRNPTLGASLYAAVVGGEGFHRAKAAGLDDTEALGAGILHGAGAYAGGRVNLENIFLKDTAVRDAVARFGFNKVAGWGVQYAKAAGANVAVNEAQQVYDNAVRMGYDGNAKAFDGLMDAAIMGLLFSAQHAPGSAARAFREANVKTVRANLEKAFGAENVKPHGESGFEVANGEQRTIVEFVKSEAELGPRDVEELAKSGREKYPKLWEEALKQAKGDEPSAKVWLADRMSPPAATRANVTIRDPATGALVDVDGLIQLVAGRATVGQTRHELLHDLARLSGARKEGDLLVDPVSGESLREEALAEALEKGIDHPITRRVKDAALGIVNLFRTEKQESPFQTARRLMRGMQEEAKLAGEAAEPKALSAEESAETAAAAEAAARAFDARAVEPGGGPGGIPLLEGPPKRVTGLVDQFGRTIAGTENLPVRAAVEPRNAPAQGQGASQAEKPITAVSAQRPPPSIGGPGALGEAEGKGQRPEVGNQPPVAAAGEAGRTMEGKPGPGAGEAPLSTPAPFVTPYRATPAAIRLMGGTDLVAAAKANKWPSGRSVLDTLASRTSGALRRGLLDHRDAYMQAEGLTEKPGPSLETREKMRQSAKARMAREDEAGQMGVALVTKMRDIRQAEPVPVNAEELNPGDLVYMDGEWFKAGRSGGETVLKDVEHAMDLYGMRNAMKNHGPESGDPNPITWDDLARVPEVIAADANPKLVGHTGGGLPVIRYEKRINGNVIVVEEVRTGRGELMFKSMRKRPSAMLSAGEGSPPTSETFRRELPHAQESIPETGEQVKPGEPRYPVDKTEQTRQEAGMTPGGYRKRDLQSAIRMRQEEPQGSLANYGGRELAEWLGKPPPPDGKLTLYRATPTGEPIRPGDYVTNERAYAEQHIAANLGGKGKITKLVATLDDIYPADGPKEFWFAPKSLEKDIRYAVEKKAGEEQPRGFNVKPPARLYRGIMADGTSAGTREWLDRYTALAAKIDVTTGDMFGTQAATREELLGKALKTKIETQKPFMPQPSGEAQAPAAARKTAAPTPEGAEAHKAPITKAGAVLADWPKDFGGANPSDDAMRFGIEHQAPEHLAEMERRYQASLARGDPLIAEAEAALARGDRAEATRITEAMERVPQLAQFWREARWAANQALTGKTESDILSLRTGEQYADRTGNPPEDRPGAATTRGRPGLAGTVPEGTAGPGRPVPAQVPGQGGKPLPREPLGAPLHKGLTPPPATVREAAAAMSLPAEEPRPGQPITEAAPPLSLHQREPRSAKDIRRTYFIESVLNPDGQREYFAGDAEGNETPRFFSAEKAAAYYEREQRLKQIEFLRGQLSRTWFQRSRLPVDEIFPEYDPAIIREAARENAANEPIRYAVEKKAGEEEAGAAKPRFANPMVEGEAWKWAATQRTAREAAGLPPHTTDAEIRAKADAILADKPGTWSALRRGELNMVDDAAKMQAAKRLLDEKVSAAIQAGDASGLAEAVEAYGRYEEAGSRMGAAFRERRDRAGMPVEEQNRGTITDALMQEPKTVIEKWKAIRPKETTPEETAQKAKDKAERIVYTAREVMRRTGLNPARLSKQTLRDSATVSEIIRIIDTLSAVPSDKAFEFWRNGLLSAPGTQTANIIGNTAAMLEDRLAQKSAEALLNVFVRRKDVTTLGELLPMWVETFRSMRKAGRHALLAFSTEQPVLEGHKVEESGLAIAGTKGRVIRAPQRMLLAADEFAKTVIYDSTIAALAHRTARAEGLKGEAFQERRQDLRTRPTEKMQAEALAEAKRLTYQERLGKVGGLVLLIRKTIPGSRYVLPFVVTPLNIIKMGLRKTPLGSLSLGVKLATGQYRGEGGQLTRDIAEQLIAWGTFAAVGAYMDDEEGKPRITGNRPPRRTPAGERGIQEALYPSQSIRIGGRWWSYARIEPMATSLAAMVDLAQAFKEGPSDEDIGERWNRLYATLKATVRDKTFLSGLGDVIRAWDEDTMSGGTTRWLTNFAASWVPNIARVSMRAWDPEFRDLRLRRQDDETLASAAVRIAKQAGQQAAPVPGWAPSPKRDWLGQPIQKTERLGPATDVVWRILSGMKIQEVPDPEALTTALDRFVWNYNQKAEKNGWTDQWWPGAARNEMTLPGYPGTDRKRYMTDDEFERFQIRRGELFLAAAGRYRWDPVDPKQTHMRHLKHLYELATDRARREAIEARTRR